MAYTPTTWVDGSSPAISAANLNKLETGVDQAHDDIATLTSSLSGKVDASLFDAHTVLAATSDNTPAALTVTEGTLVGRTSGGNIAALSAAAVRGLLGVTVGDGASTPGMVFATADNFAGIDPTGATDSAAGLTAAFAAAAGMTLLIPPGTYLINSRITITNQSVRVSAHGAVFVCGNNSSLEGSIFRFTATMGTTRSVSSVVEAITTDGRFGNNGENMWVTSLTCTTTPTGIVAGDWIKVAADDLLADYQTGARSGQFAQVVEVSGSVVVVAGVLRDPFTTNVRLAKANTAKVTWDGGTFRATQAILDGATGVGAPLQFRWLLFPEVSSVHAESLAGPFVDMRGCFGATGEDISANWLQDKTGSPGKYGYCVNDSSELSTYSRIKASRVRHAFTTGTTSVPAGNADLGNFGRSFGARVSDGWCYGATQTAWDTHGDADLAEFHGCVSVDSYAGFGLRGTRNLVMGGMVKGEHPGGCLTVSTTSSSAYAYGSWFHGVTIDGITSPAVVSISRDNGGIESRPSYVTGLMIRSRNTANPIIKADYAAVEVGDDIYVAPGGVRNVATNGGTISALSKEVAPTASGSTFANTGNGTDAAAVTASTSTNGGSAFANAVTTSSGGGTRTHATAASWVSGETGIRCTGGVGAVAMVGWQVASRSLRITGQIRFSANPTTDSSRFVELRHAGGVACAIGRTTGGLPGYKASGTSATLTGTGGTALPLNTWLEFQLTVVGDTNNADGYLEVAIYQFPGNRVPIYSATVSNLAMGMNGADFGDVRFGKPHTAPAEGNIDMKNLAVAWDIAGV